MARYIDVDMLLKTIDLLQEKTKIFNMNDIAWNALQSMYRFIEELPDDLILEIPYCKHCGKSLND